MSEAAEIEAVLFKRQGDRFIYQAPNPWVFGPTTRYLVTDAQKSELLAIVTPRRPVLRIAVITTGVLVWAALASVLVWFFSRHDEPTTLDALAIFGAILVPLFVALILALRRNLRRMQRVLVGAPRTDAHIPRRELRRAMTDAMSLRKALLLGSTWAFTSATQVFILVIRDARHPLFGDVQSYCNVFTACVGAGLAVYYLSSALRKREQTPVAI
ncbi:MAG: hypothetical protein ACJ8F3_15265 [Xanthobacteraceae bacterium]